MASPQKENGNTGIANELFEKIIAYDFPSASPLKIWLFIARKTYGFQKKTDVISISQVVKGVQLSRPTVVHWLEWLVKALLLVKGDYSQKGTIYAVNKDYEQWVVKPLELVKRRPLGSKTPLTHNKYINNKYITPNGAKNKNMYEEPIIEINELGEEVRLKRKRTTFGKYPMKIAKFYCELVGKTSGSRQLPASKELLEICQEEYPDDTIEDWHKEIVGRIKVADKYYKLKEVKDWNLSKVAENWNKILKEWSNEINKYQ